MTRTTRILIALLVAVPVLGTLTLGAAATAVYRSGSVTVEVDEPEGDGVHVRVPAFLARVAIAAVPDPVLEEALVEVGPVLPAVVAGWDELRGCPDFVLVEVVSGDDTVRVAKRGERLRLEISAEGSDVRVELPMSTVSALLSRLDRGAGDRLTISRREV